MIRILCVATMIVAVSASAWAQSDTTTTSTQSLPEVAANLQVGGERSGTPGNWVQAAIVRHRYYTDARVNAPRAGQPGGVLPGEPPVATPLSSSDTTGSIGSLSNLGSLLGGLNLGGLTGTSTSTTTGTSTSTTTGSTSSTSQADLLQQLLALQAANTKPNNTAQSTSGTTGTTGTIGTTSKTGTQQSQGGAIARLPKASDLFQQSNNGTTTTTTQDKFLTRWGDAMLQSVFSALTFGLQSSSFITAIKDALRPLILPTTDTSSNGSGTDNSGSGSNNSSGNGSGSGSSSGSGIENLDGSGGSGNSGGGSVI